MNKKLHLLLTPIFFLLIITAFVYAIGVTSLQPTNHQMINGTFVFNVSVQGFNTNNITNVSWYYLNTTGNFLINSTANDTRDDWEFNTTYVLTGIPDGNYTLNITAMNVTGSFVSNISFNFSVDNTPPTISNISLINITDGSNYRRADRDLNNTKYIKNGTLVVYVMVTDYFPDTVRIYYNMSGYAANTSHAFTTMTDNSTAGLRYMHIFNGTIPANAGDGTNLTFIIVMNDTVPGRAHVQSNNSGGTYNITLDGWAPSVGVSVSKTIIDPGTTITISCSATDTDKGTTTSISVKKPGSASYETVTSSEYRDTTTVGTYTVKCTGTDTSGRTSDSTTTFEVVGSSGSSSAGGGGGGGTTATTPQQQVEELITGNVISLGTITTSGTSKSFSAGDGGRLMLNGEHVFAITLITPYELKLTIASTTPIELTIQNGGSASVDLDEDGIDDLLIKVNRILSGRADITFKALEKPPVTTQTQPTVKKAPSQQTWLWILLVVVVIAVALYLMTMRKKRR